MVLSKGTYYAFVQSEWKKHSPSKTCGFGIYGPSKADIREGIKRNVEDFPEVVLIPSLAIFFGRSSVHYEADNLSKGIWYVSHSYLV